MKKLRVLLILTAAMFTIAACGAKGQKKTEETPKAEISSTETAEGEDEEEEAPDEIAQDSADFLLSKKLEGIGCRAVFSEYTEVDGVDVYLYSVVNKDEKELDQMLAVNAVSGEVLVYDYDNDKLLNFDRFEYYVDDGDNPASWDSSYYLEPRTVKLMPADDNSFEFTITKDEEKKPELEGVAQVNSENKKEALYDDGKLSLTFVNHGDNLEIRDNGNISGVAGIYERQE